MKAQKISPAVALEIHDIRHAVTKVRLGTVAGHDELWGALGAAGEALDYCVRIAQRDVDPSLRPAFAPPKNKPRSK